MNCALVGADSVRKSIHRVRNERYENYNINGSWWLNSVNLPRVISCVRWLDGERTN